MPPKLTNFGPNQHEVSIAPLTYFFSYETCVAKVLCRPDGTFGAFVVDKSPSRTTAKHIREFCKRWERKASIVYVPELP